MNIVYVVYYFFQTTGTVIHELLHVLGAFHEQSRPDRDQYIRVEWNNIQSGKARQFWKNQDPNGPLLTLSLIHI